MVTEAQFPFCETVMGLQGGLPGTMAGGMAIRTHEEAAVLEFGAIFQGEGPGTEARKVGSAPDVGIAIEKLKLQQRKS